MRQFPQELNSTVESRNFVKSLLTAASCQTTGIFLSVCPSVHHVWWRCCVLESASVQYDAGFATSQDVDAVGRRACRVSGQRRPCSSAASSHVDASRQIVNSKDHQRRQTPPWHHRAPVERRL